MIRAFRSHSYGVCKADEALAIYVFLISDFAPDPLVDFSIILFNLILILSSDDIFAILQLRCCFIKSHRTI